MKIDVIGPTFPSKGGISHYNTLMCEHLSKKHQVKCYSFKRLYPKLLYPGKGQEDNESKDKISINNKRIIDAMNPLTWLKAFNYVRKDKPDLLIMPWWTSLLSPMFFTWAFLTKVFTKTKVLFLCHNVLPHERKFFDKPLTKLSYIFADFYITHSKMDRDNLCSMIPTADVKVSVHPTYDVFNKKKWDKKKIKQELGLRGDVILFFGYVRPYKGLVYLIEALPKIIKAKQMTLLIVGEFWSPTKKEVLQRAEELGVKENIKIVDKYVPNEEVGKYYCASDVVVLPYTSATNSGIVQTAFGFNIPVIVSNAGGLPEVVEDEKTGYIVPTENADEIAKAVLNFYATDENFAANIEKEKYRFEWQRMIELIESFF
ncbi:MAG: glycosyltransferase [Nanoarchaeota archaeon]|nr:glycosyltransferase [Nanoarchaeota archaeon]